MKRRKFLEILGIGAASTGIDTDKLVVPAAPPAAAAAPAAVAPVATAPAAAVSALLKPIEMPEMLSKLLEADRTNDKVFAEVEGFFSKYAYKGPEIDTPAFRAELVALSQDAIKAVRGLQSATQPLDEGEAADEKTVGLREMVRGKIQKLHHLQKIYKSLDPEAVTVRNSGKRVTDACYALEDAICDEIEATKRELGVPENGYLGLDHLEKYLEKDKHRRLMFDQLYEATLSNIYNDGAFGQKYSDSNLPLIEAAQQFNSLLFQQTGLDPTEYPRFTPVDLLHAPHEKRLPNFLEALGDEKQQLDYRQRNCLVSINRILDDYPQEAGPWGEHKIYMEYWPGEDRKTWEQNARKALTEALAQNPGRYTISLENAYRASGLSHSTNFNRLLTEEYRDIRIPFIQGLMKEENALYTLEAMARIPAFVEQAAAQKVPFENLLETARTKVKPPRRQIFLEALQQQAERQQQHESRAREISWTKIAHQGRLPPRNEPSL